MPSRRGVPEMAVDRTEKKQKYRYKRWLKVANTTRCYSYR